jgi:hypothetical protein
MSAVSVLTGLKTGKDLEIEKLTTNIHIAPNGLHAENFLAVIPSLGSMTGAGTLDAKNNLDFKMAATLTGGAIGAVGSSGAGVGSLVARWAAPGAAAARRHNDPLHDRGHRFGSKFVPDVGGVAASMLKSQLGCSAAPWRTSGKRVGRRRLMPSSR